ncbi:MAG TPA: DUF3187 family protein [Holophagaceae bacterium]|nr:DUF3187 family protein [Holophagaceae bacterium]
MTPARRLAAGLLLMGAGLAAQETPRSDRVIWLAILPEPLPEGRNALTVEATSQFLRLDRSATADGRTRADLDGEEWQVTSDLALPLGGGFLNLRTRVVRRSGGFADQGFATWHALLGTPTGGREQVPKYRILYRLERDGRVIAQLDRPRTQLLDADLAWVRPFGAEARGARIGASVQLPNGRDDDFSGSGGADLTVGGAAWTTAGAFRFHGQAEHLWVGLPRHSEWRAVMDQRSLNRAWAGMGYQGRGSGILSGLGLDLTWAWMESPYRTGLPRLDRSALQQHWTFTHTRLPRWRFGFSEEGGSYLAPDITAFVGYRFGE